MVLTRDDVVFVHNDVSVPVRSRVLVPESQRVHQFVVDRPRPHGTSGAQRDLLSSALSANRAVAPVSRMLPLIIIQLLTFDEVDIMVYQPWRFDIHQGQRALSVFNDFND